MSTVVLGVTGGIGAYKSCELARSLMRRGHDVKVVMTEAATRFVTPLTFRTLTGHPVAVSLWEAHDAPVHHVSLAEEADVLVIAPCTANVLAKLAVGRADDLLTTTALAATAPILVAPAMNTRMWRDEATRANVSTLRARGTIVLEPASGDLACGDVGEGRLPEVETIAEEVDVAARRSRELAGRRLLVTAGGTREPIDAVRFLGNRASGRTGYAVAEEAALRGAEVTLVAGPGELPAPFGVEAVRVQTAEEMRAAVLERASEVDALVMTAAVADYRPAEPTGGKLAKTEGDLHLRLERTADILAEVGESAAALSRAERPVLVGFAAETERVLERAREKLERKRLDMIVANDVSGGAGFGASEHTVTFVTADGADSCGPAPKRVIARELLDRVQGLLAKRTDGDERTREEGAG